MRGKRSELTTEQKRTLDFIKDFLVQKGYPPTVEETAERFGISLRAAYDRMKALEKKGYIKRNGHGVRAIELTDKAGMPIRKVKEVRVVERVKKVGRGIRFEEGRRVIRLVEGGFVRKIETVIPVRIYMNGRMVIALIRRKFKPRDGMKILVLNGSRELTAGTLRLKNGRKEIETFDGYTVSITSKSIVVGRILGVWESFSDTI